MVGRRRRGDLERAREGARPAQLLVERCVWQRDAGAAGADVVRSGVTERRRRKVGEALQRTLVPERRGPPTGVEPPSSHGRYGGALPALLLPRAVQRCYCYSGAVRAAPVADPNRLVARGPPAPEQRRGPGSAAQEEGARVDRVAQPRLRRSDRAASLAQELVDRPLRRRLLRLLDSAVHAPRLVRDEQLGGGCGAGARCYRRPPPPSAVIACNAVGSVAAFSRGGERSSQDVAERPPLVEDGRVAVNPPQPSGRRLRVGLHQRRQLGVGERDGPLRQQRRLVQVGLQAVPARVRAKRGEEARAGGVVGAADRNDTECGVEGDGWLWVGAEAPAMVLLLRVWFLFAALSLEPFLELKNVP